MLVEQPMLFELLVNLKTAKSLGFAMPQRILAHVDEAITFQPLTNSLSSAGDA